MEQCDVRVIPSKDFTNKNQTLFFKTYVFITKVTRTEQAAMPLTFYSLQCMHDRMDAIKLDINNFTHNSFRLDKSRLGLLKGDEEG
jgi:hypothetical protein